MQQLHRYAPLRQVTLLFVLASVVGAIYFTIGVAVNKSTDFWFLLWNLLLAWIPFGLSLWIRVLLRKKHWFDWLPLAVTIVWLGFLPNTFYMLTDYIHLNAEGRANMVYDVAMFTVLIFTGVGLGFASLAIMHLELRKRLSEVQAWRVVLSILLVSSFAIYIGRYLRWNTWDIITSPAGILFDISERILRPLAHMQTFTTTLTYFVLLALGYFCLWRVIGLIRAVR